MDGSPRLWHYPDMNAPDPIPAWQLYGEARVFPDVLHIERIADRAAGLHWVIAAHRHLHLHQFFLLTHGTITMQADGAALDIRPPMVISVPRNTVHGFAFSAGTEGYVLTLPTQELPEIFGPASDLLPATTQLFTAPAPEPAAALFHALALAHDSDRSYRKTLLRALATQIACLIFAGASGPTPRPRDPRMTRFADLVLRRFRETRAAEDYANALNLSPRHLNRLCRADTGLTVAAYIDAVTFREACRLLVYTRMGIASIGYQLGFDDPPYFSRAFRRHTGLPPSDYRAQFDR